MNNLVRAAPNGFGELNLVPVQRELPRSTPMEQITASAYRQRIMILAVVLAALAIGGLITWLTPRTYTAIASVQLEQQAPRVIADPALDPQSQEKNSDRFLQTELDRVRSSSLAQLVAARMRVDSSPAYLRALAIEPSTASEQKARVIAALQDNVRAELGLNTRLAQISFTSRDPVASAKLANGYAEALAAANLDNKSQTSERAKRYLVGQLADAKGKLENSERRMLAYARSADLTTTVVQANGAGTDNNSLRAQQLALMTGPLAQAVARRIDAEQRWRQVQGTSAMSLPEVQGNGAIQALVAQRAQAMAALQEERQRHTEEYPSVREAAAKIQELDGQIGQVAGNIKTSFFGQYLAASQQEAQVRGMVGQLRGAAMAERERSVGYNSLKLEVETNKAFYDGLLQRYKEVATGSGALGANVTLVDRASPPLEPSSPNIGRNLALSGMTGLVLALLFGSVRERMHHVVRSPEDLEQDLNLPSLGVVPTFRQLSPTNLALVGPRTAQSEAYHSIAVALPQLASGVLPRTLLITSSAASEGKSTSALGIARSLTAMGKRVLLIDGDLRHPSLTEFIKNPDAPGLSDALTGAVEPESTVQHIEELGFNVISAGNATGSPVTMLSASDLGDLLDKVSDQHDIVIIDGPPIMGIVDAVLLARSVEAVLVVVQANRIHSSQLDVAISRLPSTAVVGGVVTKFDARAAGVYYGDTDYYTY